mmetsp:Transcript_46572/g.101193  ORF Transcript_46572/g.101193 Transcript_46572/m.101193 type:complete len:305 (-) Transcript_46572:279-1193(-)
MSSWLRRWFCCASSLSSCWKRAIGTSVIGGLPGALGQRTGLGGPDRTDEGVGDCECARCSGMCSGIGLCECAGECGCTWCGRRCEREGSCIQPSGKERICGSSCCELEPRGCWPCAEACCAWASILITRACFEGRPRCKAGASLQVSPRRVQRLHGSSREQRTRESRHSAQGRDSLLILPSESTSEQALSFPLFDARSERGFPLNSPLCCPLECAGARRLDERSSVACAGELSTTFVKYWYFTSSAHVGFESICFLAGGSCTWSQSNAVGVSGCSGDPLPESTSYADVDLSRLAASRRASRAGT